MPEMNIVTITLDEYMDLKEKASMNGFLMMELGRMDTRFLENERRLTDIELALSTNKIRRNAD